MKNILYLIVAVLLLYNCGEKTTSDANGSTIKTELQIKATTASVYQNLQNKERILSPVARLCAESKGYRKDEWDALNECSWAVEHYHMSLHPQLANRVGGQLTIQLTDSSLVLTHQADEYYQFVCYLNNSKHFVIRVLRPASCPEYWLVDQVTGHKTVLAGEPVFTADQQSFLLSSNSSNPKLNCPSKLALWTLQQGTYVETTSKENKNGIVELMWYNGNNWIGKEGASFVEIGF